MGGVVRATFTTAGYLASKHDVEIVSVLRGRAKPRMPTPDGVRMRRLVRKVDRTPRRWALVALLLSDAPSRLWDEHDGNRKRASLWTDVQLVRWLRSVPTGTIVVSTRPALTLLASRLAPAGVIVVAQEHQRLAAHHPETRSALVAALRNVSVLVVLTETDRAAWQDLLGDGSPAVVAIPNAVPGIPLGPGDPTARKLIAAGRLEPQKGFDLLLEAFALVATEHPEWSLDIFGKGTQRDLLEQSIARLGLAGRARVKGPTDRLGERMRDASVFVLSSRFEGFPIVLLEALAAGLAVVSFDCPTGPSDILDDGTNGILVRPEDVSALAASLVRVMDDEPLRQRLAAAGPASVLPYSIESVGGRWDELFARGA